MKNAQKTFKKYTKKKKKNKFMVFILLFVLFLGMADSINMLFSATPPLDDGGLGPMDDGSSDGREDGDDIIPDVEEDEDATYLWYQMHFQFIMTDEPEEPFEPLAFTPAVDPDAGFPTEFFTDIYPVYWYGMPPETFNVLLDGTVANSEYDYPILTTDVLNQNYSIWTAGVAYSGFHEFWFLTDLPGWTGEPLITIYDGGMFVNRMYQIPVYYEGIFSDAVLEVGYIQISWTLDGTGNQYLHPWM